MIGLVGRKVGLTRIFKEDGVSVAVATALLVLGSAMPGTVMAAPFKAALALLNQVMSISLVLQQRIVMPILAEKQIIITMQPKRRVPLLLEQARQWHLKIKTEKAMVLVRVLQLVRMRQLN